MSTTIKKGQTVATTKTNTGSIVGRSIAGDVIAGKTGAIIGGLTASKKTIISSDPEEVIQNKRVIHNYTVNIIVKDINNPNLSIHVGNDASKMNEIVGLFKVIIATSSSQ